ncbi:MarC family protein [Mesorhizobium sophorae]|uniref:MarC family protein n=1 Tax=Mesorhizobium sophorae TaxID=1300294 RepID=UPI001FD9DDC1|nr:MarC family protein [Mesorhizobium sophorae]
MPRLKKLPNALLRAAIIGKLVRTDVLVRLIVLALVLGLPIHSFAQTPFGADAPAPEIGARKIFFMLFLMLGPIKILVPFVAMTRGSDPHLRRRLATRATLFSAAALAIAGVLGRAMLENLEISLPVLAMTGGVILFLVALQTVLQQSAGPPPDSGRPGDLSLALTPLAFPTIVTPYGIAAVIVFATLATGRYDQEFTVAGIVLLILILDCLAMLFAEAILRWTGTALQIFAVVLGVTQAALGLQIILQTLSLIGVFAESAR